MTQKWSPPKPEAFQIVDPIPAPVKRAVVWPWKAGAAAWDELKYSIRSVEKYLDDKDCPFYIVCESPPYFLSRNPGRVKIVNAWLYQTAVLYGTQLADEVLWMNDDICLLKPTSWDELKSSVLHLGEIAEKDAHKWLADPDINLWRKGLARAVLSLRHKSKEPVLNYSTHTPYVYEREKALEIFKTYGLWHKIPLETLYYNHFRTSSRKVTIEKTSELPAPDAWFLNYTDSRLTPQLRDALAKLFPEHYSWEHKS